MERTPRRPVSAKPDVRQGNYRDFVIDAFRLDPHRVGVRVETSPVGRDVSVVPVPFPEEEAAALRDSYIVKGFVGGRMEIGRDDS